MFVTRGLGIALPFGIAMRIAGLGGFALNMLFWFTSFPPSSDPLIEGTHTIYGLVLLVLMLIRVPARGRGLNG